MKKIQTVKKDENGNIIAVLFVGNKNYTSKEKAVELADNNQIQNVHSVHPKNGDPYIRSNKDNKTSNNLGELD